MDTHDKFDLARYIDAAIQEFGVDSFSEQEIRDALDMVMKLYNLFD